MRNKDQHRFRPSLKSPKAKDRDGQAIALLSGPAPKGQVLDLEGLCETDRPARNLQPLALRPVIFNEPSVQK